MNTNRRDIEREYEVLKEHRRSLREKRKELELQDELKDQMKSPKHYKLEGLDIESKDVIKAVLTDEEYKGWIKGSAVKYMFRAGKKINEIQDLQKAHEFKSWLEEEE